MFTRMIYIWDRDYSLDIYNALKKIKQTTLREMIDDLFEREPRQFFFPNPNLPTFFLYTPI